MLRWTHQPLAASLRSHGSILLWLGRRLTCLARTFLWLGMEAADMSTAVSTSAACPPIHLLKNVYSMSINMTVPFRREALFHSGVG